MQHSYLRIFVASLHVPLDYGAVRDGLVRFQLIYEQVEEYLQAQILFLTAARKREIGDTAALEHFSSLCSYVIQEAGNMVCVRMRQEPVTARAVPVSAQVEGAPYLSALLKKYSQDVSALYRLALNHKK